MAGDRVECPVKHHTCLFYSFPPTGHFGTDGLPVEKINRNVKEKKSKGYFGSAFNKSFIHFFMMWMDGWMDGGKTGLMKEGKKQVQMPSAFLVIFKERNFYLFFIFYYNNFFPLCVKWKPFDTA